MGEDTSSPPTEGAVASQRSSQSGTYRRHSSPAITSDANLAIQELEQQLLECEKQFESLEARVRVAREADASAEDTIGVQPILQECKDLAVQVENLSADSLQKACDRTQPGAMEVFEGATALIDRLAALTKHAILKPHHTNSQDSSEATDSDAEPPNNVRELVDLHERKLSKVSSSARSTIMEKVSSSVSDRQTDRGSVSSEKASPRDYEAARVVGAKSMWKKKKK